MSGLIEAQIKRHVEAINRSLAYRRDHPSSGYTIGEVRSLYDQLIGMLCAYHIATTGNAPIPRYGAHLAAKVLDIKLEELSNRIEASASSRRRKVNAT